MRDLSLCLRPVETGGQRIDATDARFLHITDLAQGGKFTEVADAVSELLAENVQEVRLTGYYLYAVIHEEGLVRLPEVLQTQAKLIQTMVESLPPADKQLKLLNKSVTWFTQQLLDTLRYHQAKKDARWTGWLAEVTVPKARETTALAEQLQGLLSAPAYRTGAEGLANVATWLRDFEKQLAALPVPEAPKPAAPPEAAKAPPPPPPEEPSPFIQVGQLMQLRGSAHLVDLCNKLKAFEMLIERKDFQKAALVSDDILGTLEGFDPRRYFPELFASFGGLLNKHVRDIQEHWENKDSTEWKMLAQFYQVDLEGFVKRK